ncbi:hypothetical protein COO60DRAFT_7139 [Scenedesmus sp. NREL 46B-D3]|nr:hypothetical protein COO60DRAFT_7139 [Scenedesmus sp. NREL 46B-D3]
MLNALLSSSGSLVRSPKNPTGINSSFAANSQGAATLHVMKHQISGVRCKTLQTLLSQTLCSSARSLAPFPDGMHESQPVAAQVEVDNFQTIIDTVCHAGLGWRGAQRLEPRPVTVLDNVSKSDRARDVLIEEASAEEAKTQRCTQRVSLESLLLAEQLSDFSIWRIIEPLTSFV